MHIALECWKFDRVALLNDDEECGGGGAQDAAAV